ncbi:MAG: AAA domain-containing protein [Polyangiaceae bacterium]|nr:AAA domain-containing protein [Polyangiaceae bacterium]
MLWERVHSAICDQCTEKAAADLVSMRVETERREAPLETAALIARFDAEIVGQVPAKRTLVGAIRRHRTPGAGLSVARILIAGPRGSGKTTLGRIAASLGGWPSVVADVTGLVDAGEPGMSPEDVVGLLWRNARRDVEACEHGTVFLDGLDRSAIAARCWEGVQRGMLRLLNDGEVELPPRVLEWRVPATSPISTRDLLFVAAVSVPPLPAEAFANERALREALVREGLLPALVSRFHRVVYITPPDPAVAHHMLTRPGGILERAQRLAAAAGATLEVPYESTMALAQLVAADPDGGWAAERLVGRLVSEILADPAPNRRFVLDGYALNLAASV